MQPSMFAAPPVLGMIHVGALPGTAVADRSVAALVDAAVVEARTYREAGLDGVVVENMHDTPYLRGAVGPEIVAAMALCGRAVKAECGLRVGVQVLAAANLEALAVATAAGLDFVRVEGFAFAHVADEGIIEGCAGELLRYRRQIGGQQVQIWADIKKKHASHAITADIDLAATAEAAEFMRADAVIVTGTVTGDPPRIDDIRAAKSRSSLPIILGSGVGPANLREFFEHADGYIVGTAFKAGGRWQGAVDRRRVDEFMAALARLR
jgi:membrane complex biogenesis BtpA family protein